MLHEATLCLRQLTVLRGCVDIYPCANPLAAHHGTRRWPFFDADLNRLFPGRPDGHPPDRVAFHLVENLQGVDLVVELRGANQAFREVVQAHVRAGATRETELAMHTNVEVVWERTPGPSASAEFATQFGTSIALEGGTGSRLTSGVGKELSDGVMRLLLALDMVDAVEVGALGPQRNPRRVTDAEVHRIGVEHGGIFLPALDLGQAVRAGDILGRVVDPMISMDLEVIRSPVAGRVMAVREQPVVHPGSMVVRVVQMGEA